MTEQDRVLARLNEALLLCAAGLSEQDRAERIEWCNANDDHGTRMVPGESESEFWWGGRLLAVIPHDVLTDTEPLHAPTFVGQVPDDPSSLLEN